MKNLIKLISIVFIFCLALNLVYAENDSLNVNINSSEVNDVLIRGIDKPAIIDLEITNLDSGKYFKLYNLLGFDSTPRDYFYIGTNETKEIQMKIYPRETLKDKRYLFTYYLKDKSGKKIELQETLEILNLGNAFEIGAEKFSSNTSTLEVYIKNNEKIKFENLSIKLKSQFFEIDKEVTLLEDEKQNFEIQLNKENYKKILAGFYTFTADLEFNEQEDKIQGVIEFTETNSIETTKDSYGFFIHTTIIKKENTGNTVVESSESIKKDIISRLFTTFHPEPEIVNRKGGIVYYIWNSEIKPGQTIEIKTKTNWIFPIIIIALLTTIIILSKKYNEKDVSIRKKVSFVKAKGGEFALKVTLNVKAKKYVEKVSITDRLPKLVKLYKKFGVEEPTSIDENKGILKWNYEKLEAGEIRVLNYVVYSKVGVMGKFALPSANAVYESNGKILESNSNKTYFIAEQSGKED